MQNKTRLELADYEAENLARLQKLFARKWNSFTCKLKHKLSKKNNKKIRKRNVDGSLLLLFIYLFSKIPIRVDKKRDKFERNVLDSQERAFWDVYRPVPGCINTTEKDIKKLLRRKISHITPRLLIDNYRKASPASTLNTAPASALALAANENLMTMTVGLLTTESPTTATTTTTTFKSIEYFIE